MTILQCAGPHKSPVLDDAIIEGAKAGTSREEAFYFASGPAQALDDGPSHDPVLVGFRQKAEFLGEMGYALAVVDLGIGIGDVGAPVATACAVGIEEAADIRCHVTERIRLGRKVRR